MSINTTDKASTPKLNIYQVVTDRIIESSKNGVVPWQKPWQAPAYARDCFPRNFQTGKPYRGVNILLLWSMPYTAPFWLTFKQAQQLGGTVRKDEKGTQIVFHKQLSRKANGTEEGSTETLDSKGKRSPFLLTYYTVFNVEQCDGLTLPKTICTQPSNGEMDETGEALIQAWQGRPE